MTARRLGRAYLLLLLLFILGPALVVAIDSFNSATSFPSPFESFTLRWYGAIGDHPEFWDAFLVSLVVAVAAAAIGTLCGFLGAYALVRLPPARRNAVATLLTSPLLVPEIVVGLAALQLASLSHIPLGIPLLVAVHSVFVLPLATRVILAGFSRYDLGLEEAARSLGASPRRVVLLVTLPVLRPTLAAAFVLATILSFVNLPLSMFLTSAQTATLPVILFAYMESRIDPTIAAVATLVMVAAAATAFAVDRVLKVRLIES